MVYIWYIDIVLTRVMDTSGPFYQHGLTLIPAWIGINMYGNV